MDCNGAQPTRVARFASGFVDRTYAWGRLPLPYLGCLFYPRMKTESRLGNGIQLQRLDLLKNRLESLFQLLLRPWLAFGLDKSTVVCDRAAIIIGCLSQQFDFLSVWCGHQSILRWSNLHCSLGSPVGP